MADYVETLQARIKAEADKFLTAIGEDVEAVQVLVCFTNPDEESSNYSGFSRGNIFTRHGLIRTWLLEHESQMQASVTAGEDDG
jgi:hypothetical protein